MGKQFSGQIHLRVPPKLHEEIKREAFEKGLSISGICAQALLVRKALQDIDPWKAIEKSWEANKNVQQQQLEVDIAETIKEVRALRGKD